MRAWGWFLWGGVICMCGDFGAISDYFLRI